MATQVAQLQTTIAMTDPDKFGLLMQCRGKMDELNTQMLEHYSQFVLSLLSSTQLKNVLFSGLNVTKHQIQFNQLFQMKSTLNELIEDQNKAKKKKQTQSKPTPITLAVPKNASLTKTIPFDIISNHICHFLKMSSITHLACCDRKLAIVCHTPTSINNLMHRHDPYKYIYDEECLIHDGCYYDMNKWTVHNIHRFKNVEQLAIEYSYLEKPQIFNSFGRVKHLSLHGADWTLIDFDVALDPIQIMSSLETIKFVGLICLPVMLSFLKRNKSVHNQIKQVAFIDCTLGDINDWDDTDDDEMFVNNYAEMIHVLLPPQPNQLQTLKFVNASMDKAELTECKDANDHFADIEVIKSSLRNLKGLVYTEESQRVNNLYFHLTRNILSNLISFKKLESIHTHCQPLISCYLHQNNVPALSNVTELCISVSLQQVRTSPLYSNSLNTWLPKLERLCLVIEISHNDHPNIQTFKLIFEKILRSQIRLKVFQIVTLIDCGYDNTDPAFCAKRLKIVTEMINECTKVLHLLRIETYTNYSKRPLLFRLHVKSCHYTETECVIATNTQRPFIQALENMIVKYLMLYPIGKIQCRFTCNAEDHDLGWELQRNMKGLDTFLKVCVKRSGNVFPFNDPPRCCYNKTDFKQGSISAVPKHVSDQDVHHESRWKVDCRYCCNTPWV
eukprot:595841_1